MPIELVIPSSHLILCCPLLLLPPTPRSIRVFSNESALCRWPKYWSFSFSISPSNEHPGLISFRMDWLDLLAKKQKKKKKEKKKKNIVTLMSTFFFFLLTPILQVGLGSAGVGNGNSLQYSCLGNPPDRGP